MKAKDNSVTWSPGLSVEDLKRAQIDSHAKNILMRRPVLSRLVQRALEETKDMSPEEVSACIVPPDDAWGRPLPTEVKKGGMAGREFPQTGHRQDIICAVRLPSSSQGLPVLINVEPQAAHLKDIVERGVMYLAEMVVDQNGRYVNMDEDNSDYSGLLKCTAVLLVLNPPQYMQNTIKSISLSEKDVLGSYSLARRRYDKMQLVIMGLSQGRCSTDKVIDFLNVLFSKSLDLKTKSNILSEEYGYPVDRELEEEMQGMIGLGDYMYNSGASDQHKVDTLAHLKALMAEMDVSVDRAMKILHIAEEEKEYFRNSIEGNVTGEF